MISKMADNHHHADQDGDEMLLGRPLGGKPKYLLITPTGSAIVFSHMSLLVVFLQRMNPLWSKHRVYSVLEGVDRKSTKAMLNGYKLEKIARPTVTS